MGRSAHDKTAHPAVSGDAHAYTAKEEIANSLTHGIGAALSIAGLVVLVVLAAQYGDAWRVVSFSIYGATLVMLFTASTLYHSFSRPRIRKVLRIIDHCSIYLLIAGSYTPFMLVIIRGSWGWSLFGVIWGLALLGILMKTLFIGRNRILSTLTFIFMGWLCVIALKEMIAHIEPGGMLLLAAGGLFYTLGAVFYIWKRLPYNHAVWHLFVLGGGICHYFSILLYVL